MWTGGSSSTPQHWTGGWPWRRGPGRRAGSATRCWCWAPPGSRGSRWSPRRSASPSGPGPRTSCITGEGAFDYSSGAGKVPHGVAQVAEEALRPCVVLAGKVLVGSREMRALGIESAYSLVDLVGEERAFAEPAAALAELAARTARTWSR